MGANEDDKRVERNKTAASKLDDHNAELAGVKAGYRYDALPGDHASNPDSREGRARKARQNEAQLATLSALLADPDYAALYNETFDKLRDAERATEAALTAARNALESAAQELQDITERAAALPDGTKVFRDADGNVVTAAGKRVTGADLDAILWQGDEPSYEDYQAARDAVSAAEDSIESWRRYQTDVLGQARERLTDEDNPPSAKELERIQEDIESKAPEALQMNNMRAEVPDSEFGFAAGPLPNL